MAICSRCHAAPRLPYSHSWCRDCHNAQARADSRPWRDLTSEQRRRANARSMANIYQRRGKLKPQPCETCGIADVQKHHEDYARPLDVRWFCRACHRNLHRGSYGEPLNSGL